MSFLASYSYLMSRIVLNPREMDSLYNTWYWVVMNVLFLHILAYFLLVL